MIKQSFLIFFVKNFLSRFFRRKFYFAISTFCKKCSFQLFFFVSFSLRVHTVVSCFDAGGGSSLKGWAGGIGWVVADVPAERTDIAAEPADEAD